MNKKSKLKKIFGITVAVALLAAACAQTPPKEKGGEKSWSEKMNSLQQTLVELFPRMLQFEKFDSRKEKEKTRELFDQFAKHAHSISETQSSKIPDPDPSIEMLSKMFESEVEATQYDLKSGYSHFARDRFLSLTHYCFACHTTSNFGPDFSVFEKNADFAGLTPYEKGLFYSSTRRFKDSYGQFIDEIEKEKRTIHWQESIYRALTIAVRVEKDPDLAEKAVEKVLGLNDLPVFVKEDARKWKKSIQEWKKEKKRKLSSESGYFHEAIRLMNAGKDAREYSLDKSGMVYFLRASSVLHDGLGKYPDGKRFPEFLYLLGQCYDTFSNLRIWNLANRYYEMCIDRAPHTDWSKACYRRFEQNIIVGYTGSGGTDLPDDVRIKLAQLRKKSELTQ